MLIKIPYPLKKILNPIASLKLTVACLLISILLVFFGTLAQVEFGIWEAQNRYFSTWWVWETIQFGEWSIPLFLPGGYLVGSVLLINLLAAHGTRFKLTWKKSGIFLTHIGILLLIVGGFITGATSHEGAMSIREGDSSRFIESFHERELAVVDKSDPETDQVVAFDTSLFQTGYRVDHPDLPFFIDVHQYFPNSRLRMREDGAAGQFTRVNRGFGQRIAVRPHRETFKQDEQNLISMEAKLVDKDSNQSLGYWLFTNAIVASQSVEAAGKTYQISLRPTRTYVPYAIKLIDFSHDKYPGTQVPVNFSSKVQLANDEGTVDRESLIYMNHPLRFEGRTFYQQSFGENDKLSVLQVVKNPGWQLPYLSCALLALGLCLQFGIHLGQFLKRRGA